MTKVLKIIPRCLIFWVSNKGGVIKTGLGKQKIREKTSIQINETKKSFELEKKHVPFNQAPFKVCDRVSMRWVGTTIKSSSSSSDDEESSFSETGDSESVDSPGGGMASRNSRGIPSGPSV